MKIYQLGDANSKRDSDIINFVTINYKDESREDIQNFTLSVSSIEESRDLEFLSSIMWQVLNQTVYYGIVNSCNSKIDFKKDFEILKEGMLFIPVDADIDNFIQLISLNNSQVQNLSSDKAILSKNSSLESVVFNIFPPFDYEKSGLGFYYTTDPLKGLCANLNVKFEFTTSVNSDDLILIEGIG